jgi:hypothetical protein
MAEINPLAFAGRSIDDTLGKRLQTAAAAADALPKTIVDRTLANRGAMAKQGLANIGSLTNKLAGLGINYGPNYKQGISNLGNELSMGRRSNVLSELYQKLGIGSSLQPGDTAKSFLGGGLTRPVGQGVPGNVTTAVAGRDITKEMVTEGGIEPTRPGESVAPIKEVKRQRTVTSKPGADKGLIPTFTLPGTPPKQPAAAPSTTARQPQKESQLPTTIRDAEERIKTAAVGERIGKLRYKDKLEIFVKAPNGSPMLESDYKKLMKE